MNVVIITRSCNSAYYAMASYTFPNSFDKVRCTQYSRWQDAFWYLKNEIIYQSRSYDYLINIDEDCFITDYYKFIDAFHYFVDGGYTNAGLQDTFDNIPHRFNSPEIHNPFLNFFHLKKCAEIIKDIEPDENTLEIYNPIFEALNEKGKPMHFPKPETLEDGITTKGEFYIHTWYSREKSHIERIVNIYNQHIK